jgi:hypothetical protein
MMMDLEVRIIQRVDCILDTNRMRKYYMVLKRRRERGADEGGRRKEWETGDI